MIKKTKKTVAYVTGTRADFGLMSGVLHSLDDSSFLDLQIFITGMHLMPQFGSTAKEVKKEFPDAINVPIIFEGDNPSDMAGYAGKFLSKMTTVFSRYKPDLVLVLGDRIEMLCTAVTCLYLGIPVGHIHGGDKSATVDELARHAITKLSHIHFPATKTASQRIKKMGEEDWRIHIVGSPALDTILNEQLPDRDEILNEFGIGSDKKFILVTQHPISELIKQSAKQMTIILEAVKHFNLPTIVIYPNADAGGREMIRIIDKEKNNSFFRIYPSLPFKKFIGLEKEASVWVGNSSAAMIESSSFKTPVVNIGPRQSGREHGGNVINVGYSRQEIISAISKSLNDRHYLSDLQKVVNPWGDGQAGRRIVNVLESLELGPKLLHKQITY